MGWAYPDTSIMLTQLTVQACYNSEPPPLGKHVALESKKGQERIAADSVHRILALSRQSSPKRGNERLILCVAALWALQHNSLLVVRVFVLSRGEPFNHEGVALFTHHGCLPS